MTSVEHTNHFELPIPVDELFPLFSPEGETLWVPGWEYRNIMGTTELCEDYIFETGSHDHGSTQAVWLVKKYDPADYLVQFYKVESGDKVGVITVQCIWLSETETRVEVTYKYTALGKAGEEFIATFDKGAYESFIGEWEELLRTYFKL